MKQKISLELFGTENIEFEFDKINLYFGNGFFKKHQDTPREGSIGTCVITLPIYYENGDLIIYDSDGNPQISKSGEITAFYPNLIHEIMPLKKDFVFLYHFLLKIQKLKFYKKKQNLILGVLLRKKSQKKIEKVKNFKNLIHQFVKEEKEKIGVLLGNYYSLDNIQQREFYKGDDYELFQSLQDENSKLLIFPVIIHHTLKNAIVGLNKNLFDYTDEMLDLKDINFLGDVNKILKLIINEEDEIEYTGNESREAHRDNFYYSVAIVLVPK